MDLRSLVFDMGTSSLCCVGRVIAAYDPTYDSIRILAPSDLSPALTVQPFSPVSRYYVLFVYCTAIVLEGRVPPDLSSSFIWFTWCSP